MPPSRPSPWAPRLGLRYALVAYGLGAVVVEAISGVVERQYGLGVAYGMVTLVEEGLEMTACVLAIVAVLRMVGVGEIDSRRAILVPLELERDRLDSSRP